MFDNQDLFINKMLYIYEQSKKFEHDKELTDLLSDFNTLIASQLNKERLVPIIKKIFDLTVNQVPGNLLYTH